MSEIILCQMGRELFTYVYFLCSFLNFLHSVIGYQIFLSNTNNLQMVLRLINGFLTSTTTLGQSGPRSNNNEGVFNTPQRFRTEDSPLQSLMSYSGQPEGEGILTSAGDSQYILSLTDRTIQEFQKLGYRLSED